jgi:hypothetical protein
MHDIKLCSDSQARSNKIAFSPACCGDYQYVTHDSWLTTHKYKDTTTIEECSDFACLSRSQPITILGKSASRYWEIKGFYYSSSPLWGLKQSWPHCCCFSFSTLRQDGTSRTSGKLIDHTTSGVFRRPGRIRKSWRPIAIASTHRHVLAFISFPSRHFVTITITFNKGEWQWWSQRCAWECLCT